VIAHTSNSTLGDWVTEVLRLRELEEDNTALRRSIICALNQLLDLKDLNTGIHSTRLAEWALRVARSLQIPEKDLFQIEVAALLHDIGKIGVPDAILRKPSRLTPEEKAIMDKHPEFSWSILRMLPGLEQASLLALHHHENYDGTGYPGRLKGEEIPLGSRIVSVIDAFDAMISNRPYRQGLPPEEAVRRLVADSVTQFDPIVVQCFIPICRADMSEVFAATRTSPSVAL
jgi:HD-GYP domain-containing protein (c-di-GMP phosphodiesterase class II)